MIRIRLRKIIMIKSERDSVCVPGKAYSQQLNNADDYPKLNQVIFLGFLDFELFKEIPNYATRHLLLEEKTNGHQVNGGRHGTGILKLLRYVPN